MTKALDQDLRAVLVLLQVEAAHQLGARGPEPARDVGDAPAVEERHHTGEQVHPGVAEMALALELTEPA